MASLESCNPSILVAMERLWFHKIVLCSEQNICPNKTPPIEIMSPSLSSSSSSSSSSDQVSSNSSSEPTDYSDDDDIIQDFSFAVHGSLPTILATHHQQMDYEDEDDEKEKLEQEDDIKELIPTRPNVVMKRAKSSKTPIRRRIKSARLRLERTLSCKTLGELEQEEVKGFMDLGFIFDKERLTPRMMSVVPGLQRLQGKEEEEEEDDNGVEARQDEDDMKMVEGEAKKKPYLSEAWLIKRPDSPLVRLRMSRPSTTTNDMKKHLKIWAKTVAYSAIKE